MSLSFSRRKFLGTVGIIGSLPFAGRAFAADAPHVTYAETEGFYWLTPYVASAINSWKDAGLDLETIKFPTGRLGLDALVAGKVDYAICTDTPYMYPALRGLKPRIVAPFAVLTAGSQPMAVRIDKIKKPADFKGATVATQLGGGGHYFLTRFLSYYKIGIRDVHVVSMQPADMVTALARGDVDALCWDSQSAHAAVERGDGKVQVFPTTDSGKYIRQHCLLIANNDVVTKRPETCDGVTKALYAAQNFIEKNPDKALDYEAARTKSSREASKEAFDNFTWKILFDDELLDDQVFQTNWAIENNLAAKPDGDIRAFYRALFYTDSVKKIVPGGVTLKS